MDCWLKQYKELHSDQEWTSADGNISMTGVATVESCRAIIETRDRTSIHGVLASGFGLLTCANRSLQLSIQVVLEHSQAKQSMDLTLDGIPFQSPTPSANLDNLSCKSLLFHHCPPLARTSLRLEPEIVK